jgi:DNA-binding NtrC family response regulator
MTQESPTTNGRNNHHASHASHASHAPHAPHAQRRVMVVEDHEATRRQLQHVLQVDPSFQVDAFHDGKAALEALSQTPYSILITDLRMPKLDGMALIGEIQAKRLPVTVIVTTGHGSIDEAVQAMRLGAYDFLTKPIDLDHLRLVLERAFRERALEDEVAALREQMQTRYSFQNVLSKNSSMHAVFELINNVAHTNTTVLIEGETGTGKEQIARALHAASHHREGPFVAINCAALPEALLESELFGHEKGAFTSAVGQRRGRFELADGGAIFLDEIGDIPAAMQAKMLRVLQERAFERVGGTETIKVNVRVIAATNRPLPKLVKAGQFREDLFYRLNVVKIDLPPLRERPDDIPILAVHFSQKYAPPGSTPKTISPEAMQILLNYSWPGNIRELENAIERASVTSRDSTIEPSHLPPEIVAPAKTKSPFSIDLNKPLTEHLQEMIAEVEKSYIRRALKKTRGHVGKCAQICGLSRRSITAKISEYGLDKSQFKDD